MSNLDNVIAQRTGDGHEHDRNEGHCTHYRRIEWYRGGLRRPTGKARPRPHSGCSQHERQAFECNAGASVQRAPTQAPERVTGTYPVFVPNIAIEIRESVMNINITTEVIDQDRREFLGAAAMGIVVAGAASLLPSPLAAAPTADVIRPFRVDVPEGQLVDLRRRVLGARGPDRETVSDASQGVQFATTQKLARYWATEYDWRKVEARLNALPQFITEIDGVDIHFIHVRSKHEDALPLIVTHGWPGSIIEQLKIIEPLTNPTSHGGSASDAFHVVIPSLPGHGFSGKPTVPGWTPVTIARAWATLMQRLGYAKYVAQGGDWGNAVSEVMALQRPPGLLGIHTNMEATVPAHISKALAYHET